MCDIDHTSCRTSVPALFARAFGEQDVTVKWAVPSFKVTICQQAPGNDPVAQHLYSALLAQLQHAVRSESSPVKQRQLHLHPSRSWKSGSSVQCHDEQQSKAHGFACLGNNSVGLHTAMFWPVYECTALLTGQKQSRTSCRKQTVKRVLERRLSEPTWLDTSGMSASVIFSNQKVLMLVTPMLLMSPCAWRSASTETTSRSPETS